MSNLNCDRHVIYAKRNGGGKRAFKCVDAFAFPFGH